MALADMNGDGKPDVTVTNAGDDTVSVLLNNGDGTFAAKVDYPTGSGPGPIAVADLNGDGKPDIAVTNGGGALSVLLNDGAGAFPAKIAYDGGWWPVGIVVADVNGDGMCRPRDDAARRTFDDGHDGIDNSFGGYILPILITVIVDSPARANTALAHGAQTLLIDLDKLGAGPDDGPLSARLYEGALLGKVPVYDGTDTWPVRPDLLADAGDIGSAKIQTATSYVVGNTWVGRFQGYLPIELTFAKGIRLRLTIRHPIVTMDLDPQRRAAANGTLAGLLVTDALVAELRDLFPRATDTSLCSGNLIDSITDGYFVASFVVRRAR